MQYDEPDLVVRNIWLLDGGWYDGNPAHMKPAKHQDLAKEIALMAGGACALAEHAQALKETNPRFACHLVEMAVRAEPENRYAHEVRLDVYQYRRNLETSLMAKGLLGTAANESKSLLGEE